MKRTLFSIITLLSLLLASSVSYAEVDTLPDPMITAWADEYEAAKSVENLFDDNNYTEYTSNGWCEDSFVDFDFGYPVTVAGFYHLDREGESTNWGCTSAVKLIFSNNPDFSDPCYIDVNLCGEGWGNPDSECKGVTEIEFDQPVTYRYLRWDVTEIAYSCDDWGGWVGGSELEFRGPAPVKLATNASPHSEEHTVATDKVLSWTPGEGAVSHNLYLSTDYNDVNEGDANSPAFMDNLDVNYFDPCGLANLATYYWRIDEVNDEDANSPYRGVVWRFKARENCWETGGLDSGVIVCTWSTHDKNKEGRHTVDRSGLDDEWTHSAGFYGEQHWLSGGRVEPGMGPNSPSNTEGPEWIAYEFDRDYPLSVMWVWNYNSSFEEAENGLRNVIIEYSTDANTWTKLGDFEFNSAPGEDYYVHNTEIDFGGVDAKYVVITPHETAGNWGGSEYGLSELRFGVAVTHATNPNPAHARRDVPIDTAELSWYPGKSVANTSGHHIWFNTNFDDVNDRTEDANKERTTSSTWNLDLPLELGQTYYWRVDEYNDTHPNSPWYGHVWRFTVANYYIIEDFDSYTSGDDLAGVWYDGLSNYTGSFLDLEKEFVRRVSAMEYEYDNHVSPFYSEAYREFSPAEDWSADNIKALTLWFRGERNNDAERMYVGLEDSAANYGESVYYGDANNLKIEEWQEWNIELQEIADQGVNLNAVEILYIGFGERGEDEKGGQGYVYFEDIRRYVPRCVSDFAHRKGSFDGDCYTDYYDLDVLGQDWLLSGYDVVASSPDDNRLEAHYKLDEKTGLILSDSSGNGNDATWLGDYAPEWEGLGGYIDGALNFDGITNSFAQTATSDVKLQLTESFSIALWAKPYPTLNDWAGIVAMVDPNNPADPNNDTLNYWVVQFNTGDNKSIVSYFDTGPNDGYIDWWVWLEDISDMWNHLALVYDADANILTTYLNDTPTSWAWWEGDPVGGLGYLNIGADRTEQVYRGMLDDIRIYDYALSQAEILSLMLEPSKHFTVDSTADADESDAIDFRDFAIMTDYWLTENFWP